MPFINFFLPFWVLLKLLLIFLPLVIWSGKRFSAFGFSLVDNIVWWLATLQFAALATLWVKNFTLLPFLLCYWLLISVVTYVRWQTKEEAECSHYTIFSNAFVLGLICAGLMLPLTTYLHMPQKGDALAYHLPMAVQWVQTHSIFAQDSRVWFYPGGYELLNAIFFTLTGNSQLWFMPDILAWTLLIVSSYRLLTILRVNEKASAIFVGAIVLSPIFYLTLGAGGNDLWATALVIAMTVTLLNAIQNNSRQARAAGLLCIAGLACAKYATLPWLLVTGLYIVFRKKAAFAKLGKLELIAALFFMVIALSFPVRNYLLTGNPFFPMGIGSLFPWGDTSHIVSLISKITLQQLSMSELVHQPLNTWRLLFQEIYINNPLIFLVIIAVIVSNIFRVREIKWTRSEKFICLLLLLAVLMFIVQPLVVENVPGTQNQLNNGSSLRFFLPCIMLLSLLLFSKIQKRHIIFYAILFFIYSFFFIQNNKPLFSKQDLVVTLLLSLALPIFWIKIRKIWPIFFLSLLAIIMVEITEYSKPVLVKSMRAFRYNHVTQLSSILPKNASPQVIIVSTALRAWPLIGLNFKNRVIAVGMALPAEDFVKEVRLYDASILIIAKENLDKNSLKAKNFPPETKRILPLLGDEWKIKYQDDLVMVFVKK